MKNNLFLAAFFVLASVGASAQAIETPVGIIPGGEPGVLKVIYARASAEMVTVRFINENGTLITDRIRAEEFDRGFQKKYDVRRIQENNFWIEVQSGALLIRYRMEPNAQGKLVPTLETYREPQPMVAANH